MDEQLALVSQQGGVERKDGAIAPFNASDALKFVLNEYAAPVPRRDKPRLGKAAKELLEDGFSPEIVCIAMLRSLYRSRIDLVERFAMELSNASTGNHLSPLEDKSRLEAVNRRQRWEAGDDFIIRALKKESSSELQRR